ncbi:MAG: hypothetical protein HRU12_11225, partial [Phaeodactylibacter sp.]|nr:hypothetical protein [Phaeodactylibacter sp.]
LPGSGLYNIPQAFQLTPGSAGNGPVSFILTDQEDLTCQDFFSIQDPGTCVSPCSINAPNLLGVQCDDLGTPNDPNDDELLITLNPVGISTGNTYTVSGPGLNFLNTIGSYGTPTTFRLTNASALPNTFLLTISDNQSSNCSIQVSVSNTAPCSTPLPCNITNTIPFNVSCTNGEVINFTISPNHAFGTQYNLTIPDGTILGQNTGLFGAPMSFSFLPNSPQSPSYSITIRDADNDACTSIVTIDNPCDDCNITNVNVLDIQCGNNSTGAIPDDDQMIVTLQPTGTNLGSGYSVLANGLLAQPSEGTYNTSTTFTLPAGTAGSSSVNITVIDNDDPSCTFNLSLSGPGTCSDACDIFDQGLVSISCNDNGTISDASDDFITFSLDVFALSSSNGYSISADGTIVTPATGTYNTLQVFSLPLGSAGNGGTTITITDLGNAGCGLSFFLFDPGDCSSACNILATEVNLFCQDGGTPGIFSDDTYLAQYEIINPTAASGSSWVSNTSAGDNFGSYDDIANLGPFLINDGPVSITFTDVISPSCSITLDLSPPPSCSDTCIIQSVDLNNISCDNDTLTFDINPIGNALDTIYHIQVDSGSIAGSSQGPYGTTTTFNIIPDLPLSDDFELTLTDGTVSECQFILTINNACKTCEIGSVIISNIECQNAGTASDPDDDYVNFDLFVTSEFGSAYQVELANGSTLAGTGTYGVITQFSMPAGSAGYGNTPLVVRDINDPTCSQVFIVQDPGSCSDQCLLTVVIPSDITCNDNNTPGNPSDDGITFNLTVNGLNTAGSYALSFAGGSTTPE